MREIVSVENELKVSAHRRKPVNFGSPVCERFLSCFAQSKSYAFLCGREREEYICMYVCRFK